MMIRTVGLLLPYLMILGGLLLLLSGLTTGDGDGELIAGAVLLGSGAITVAHQNPDASEKPGSN